VPLAERKLIARIRRQAGRAARTVLQGIGDDAAVLVPPRGHELLVTTDFCLEGVHFRRDWHSAGVVGQRCLTRGLSDIAAMGGEPIAAFLSLALPRALPQQWVDGFFAGFLRLAKRFDVTLAGGDIAHSLTGVLADVMVVGSVPRAKAILRSGAKPGDVIYVTGRLGGAAAELQSLGKADSSAQKRRLRMTPLPRVAVGRGLREKGLAHAMIDLSDGLSVDLAHICEESGVGAVVNQHLLPIASGAALNQALHGGEDYELLFTASPRAKVPVEITGVPVTEIGWITRERKVLITDLMGKPKPLKPKGWEHFNSRASLGDTHL